LTCGHLQCLNQQQSYFAALLLLLAADTSCKASAV
jgi:hypothetical protein